MRRIAVVTSTRAEFGLLFPVICELRKFENEKLKIDLIVTGTHLSKVYGETVEEIRSTNLRIDKEIFISVASSSPQDISANQAEVLVKFTQVFAEENYDGIVILGDRYEMLAVAIAAGNTRTPIFHLCGGDTTEGAMDEWVRHSITKMSFLHFPTNEVSRLRVIQLGEDPSRVFNYGSTSVDNILARSNMEKLDALKSIGMQACDYAICTYHPVTMNSDNIQLLMEHFIGAIQDHPEIEFIVTKSNADQGGAQINKILDNAEKDIQNLHVFASLGVVRYLSLMKHSLFVLGNSSSGIIEAPVLKVPTINIGDRQKGRLQTESIINCSESRESINEAISKATCEEFLKVVKKVESPYGNGNTSVRIAETIVKFVIDNQIDLKKNFWNLGEN